MIQQSRLEVVNISNIKFVPHFNTGKQYAKKFKGVEKEGEKTCSKCWKSKLLSQFSNYASNKYEQCAECLNKRKRAYKYRETRRVKLICMMGYGGCCQCCGDSRIEMLTIEHIRNKGYKHDTTYDNTTTLMRELIRLGFPVEYTCLCSGCNQLTRYGKPCVHSSEYKKWYDKSIQPYRYEKQKELDELERKWNAMNGTGE